MKQHYVTFYSPGTMVAEQTTKVIKGWDVDSAVKMMPEIEERYGAKPYGFRFTTKKRGWRDMHPVEIDRSGMYYVNCRVQTLEDVEAEHGKSATLARNMRTNGWESVVTTEKGWAWSQPLHENDVVL
jgi:hypothetical protein